MPKGYLVANIRIKDKEKFAAFLGMAGPVIKAHGGKVLARGPDPYMALIKWSLILSNLFDVIWSIIPR